MKLSVAIVVFLFLCLGSTSTRAQEPKFYALYLVKFAESISFKNVSGPVKIGVYGAPEIFEEVQKISKLKSTVQAVFVEDLTIPKDINLLFIATSKLNEMENIRHEVLKNTTVFVSQIEGGLSSGPHISFLIEEGKLRFKIDKDSFQSNDLLISNSLVSLSK